MHNYDRNGSRAASAQGFVALFAVMLAMGLALAASPAEAAPFAYVTNSQGRRQCLGDRHGHQLRGDPDPGGGQ